VVTVADGARQSQESRGAGDAEAIALYAEAFGQDPEFFSFYRSMEAYKKSFNQDDTMVINPTGDFFKFFELPSN
jgi:membrane protease subunit HflC